MRLRGRYSRLAGGAAAFALACTVQSTRPPAELGRPSLEAALLGPDSAPPLRGVVRVRFTNRSADPVFGAIDVRAEPGDWLRPLQQELHLYRIPPDTTVEVEAPYAFSKMSPGAVLRIRAGTPEQEPGGSFVIPEPVLVRSISAGGSPEALAFMARFDTLATPHIALYALRGSPAARRLAELARQRESAAAAIGALLGVDPPAGVRMVFYPDSATKTTDTRHIGNGWANNSIVVEIYNDSVHVDPYHELTHIVAARLGAPPAWLDEGLATYVSERLGADALELLGAPGRPVRAEACRLQRAGHLIPIPLLFAVDAFGGDSVPGGTAYAESAAMVAYLVERTGEPRLRDLYRRLESGVDWVPVEKNRRTFEALTGASLDTFEREFRIWLATACR